MHLHINHNFQISGDIGALRLKRGDALSLSLIFTSREGKPYLPSLSSIIFGAKSRDHLSGDFLVYADCFDESTTASGIKCRQGVLQLNSEALALLIGEEEYVEILAELEFSAPGWKKTSQTLPLRIDNDIIKNTEGLPLSPAPEYVTKSYVDGCVALEINEAFLEKENRFQEILTEVTESSQQVAIESKAVREAAEEIKNSTGTVETLVQTAKEYRDSAQDSRQTAQDAIRQVEEARPFMQHALTTISGLQEQAETASANSQAASRSAVEALDSIVQYKSDILLAKYEVAENTQKTASYHDSALSSKREAENAAQEAKKSEEIALEAAIKASAVSNAENLYKEIGQRIDLHNNSSSAHQSKFEKKLDSSTAALTYATKTELSSKLEISDASRTYAPLSEMGKKLNIADAASTYATLSGLNTKLSIAAAQSTYATLSKMALKLDSSTAASLYATKEELPDLSPLATKNELALKLDSATAEDTYATKSSLLLAAPPGSVSFYCGNTPPEGWLECNGASLSRSVYEALFAAIGTTFGYNNSETFKIPDLRGYFLRTWDHGRGIDSGRSFGAIQNDATQRMIGAIWGFATTMNLSAEGPFYKEFKSALTYGGNNSTEYGLQLSFDNNRSVRTANEERPKNIALLSIIKY